MSMDMLKCYGYGYSVAVTQYFAKLDMRKIILGLMVLYMALCFFAPDIVSHAATFDTEFNNQGVGNGKVTGLPWEAPMMTLQRSLTGPVAKAIAMIVVVVAGIFVALGEGGPAGRLVGRLVFGLGLLFGALQIINAFMGD